MRSIPLVEIPISQIRIANPRPRNRMQFQAIVNSISAVGLKKPITVTKRPQAEDGTLYDLVCGQGRMEAFLAIGQTTIPANVISADRESQFVMSLVENIARRPPSYKDLFREVASLKGRGYSAKEIACKLGREVSYISAIDQLIDRHAPELVEAVEANRIPLSIALIIARAKQAEVQQALAQAYESGELRGARLRQAKRIIANQTARWTLPEERKNEPRLTGRALVKEYERRTRDQQSMMERASSVRDKLLLLRSAIKTLLKDTQFLALLELEKLQDIPAELIVGGCQDEPTRADCV